MASAVCQYRLRPAQGFIHTTLPPRSHHVLTTVVGYNRMTEVYFAVLLVIPLALQLPYLVRQSEPVLDGVLMVALVLLFSQRCIRALIEH
jgi:hypothetical protein